MVYPDSLSVEEVQGDKILRVNFADGASIGIDLSQETIDRLKELIAKA